MEALDGDARGVFIFFGFDFSLFCVGLVFISFFVSFFPTNGKAMDADVGEGSDAFAASVAPTVPRLEALDLSSLVDGSSDPSLTQIAMKIALEGQIGGADVDVAATSPTPAMPAHQPAIAPLSEEEEEAQGPSTPTSARAAPVEADTCTICTGNLGENGGTLSLLCGKKKGDGAREFFLGKKNRQNRWALTLGDLGVLSVFLSSARSLPPPRNNNNPTTPFKTSGHPFCSRCILRWRKQSRRCPICRERDGRDLGTGAAAALRSAARSLLAQSGGDVLDVLATLVEGVREGPSAALLLLSPRGEGEEAEGGEGEASGASAAAAPSSSSSGAAAAAALPELDRELLAQLVEVLKAARDAAPSGSGSGGGSGGSGSSGASDAGAAGAATEPPSSSSSPPQRARPASAPAAAAATAKAACGEAAPVVVAPSPAQGIVRRPLPTPLDEAEVAAAAAAAAAALEEQNGSSDDDDDDGALPSPSSLAPAQGIVVLRRPRPGSAPPSRQGSAALPEAASFTPPQLVRPASAGVGPFAAAAAPPPPPTTIDEQRKTGAAAAAAGAGEPPLLLSTPAQGVVVRRLRIPASSSFGYSSSLASSSTGSLNLSIQEIERERGRGNDNDVGEGDDDEEDEEDEEEEEEEGDRRRLLATAFPRAAPAPPPRARASSHGTRSPTPLHRGSGRSSAGRRLHEAAFGRRGGGGGSNAAAAPSLYLTPRPRACGPLLAPCLRRAALLDDVDALIEDALSRASRVSPVDRTADLDDAALELHLASSALEAVRACEVDAAGARAAIEGVLWRQAVLQAELDAASAARRCRRRRAAAEAAAAAAGNGSGGDAPPRPAAAADGDDAETPRVTPQGGSQATPRHRRQQQISSSSLRQQRSRSPGEGGRNSSSSDGGGSTATSAAVGRALSKIDAFDRALGRARGCILPRTRQVADLAVVLARMAVAMGERS